MVLSSVKCSAGLWGLVWLRTNRLLVGWLVCDCIGWCVIEWVYVVLAFVLHDNSFCRFFLPSLMASMWTWSVWFRTQTVTIVSFFQTDGEVRAGASYLNTYRA